ALAVAIHARTRAEKSAGEAHGAMIGGARRAVGSPAIGNGDVRDAEGAVRMLEQTGCDGVMLGRAAFGDPWVFRRIRALVERGEALPPPTAAERLEAGVRHLAMMERAVGPEQAAREMRKHVAWYIKGLPNSARVREQVNHTRTSREMAELLRAYLGELAAAPPADPDHAAAAPAAGTPLATGGARRPAARRAARPVHARERREADRRGPARAARVRRAGPPARAAERLPRGRVRAGEVAAAAGGDRPAPARPARRRARHARGRARPRGAGGGVPGRRAARARPLCGARPSAAPAARPRARAVRRHRRPAGGRGGAGHGAHPGQPRGAGGGRWRGRPAPAA